MQLEFASMLCYYYQVVKKQVCVKFDSYMHYMYIEYQERYHMSGLPAICTYLLRKPRSNKRHLERISVRVQGVERVRYDGPHHGYYATGKLVANCNKENKFI